MGRYFYVKIIMLLIVKETIYFPLVMSLKLTWSLCGAGASWWELRSLM